MSHSKFPTVLKQLRIAKDLTQDDLAEVLALSRSTIAGYESRNKQPDYDKLVQIAEYFHVSIDYLLTGKTDTLTNPHAQLISDRELECILLDYFRNLSYEYKQRVIEYTRLLTHKDTL